MLHDEVPPPVCRGARVEHPGDIWVIREGKRLALGFKPTWSESMPGLITLTATRRRNGCVCSARYTAPMPP